MKRIIALVLAGGRGNRFWPRSSADLPKQFLKINDTRTLFQQTVDRLKKVVSLEDIYIITPRQYLEIVCLQVRELDKSNVIVEPAARDTAAAIGYAALLLQETLADDAVMLVVPSDHLIKEEERWINVLNQAARIALTTEVVTVGIPPIRTEIGYGHIVLGEEITAKPLRTFFVETFVEKPALDEATRLVQSGRCLWNSGMFIWRLGTICALFQRHLPNHYAALKLIRELQSKTPKDASENLELKRLVEELTPLSIDYGILEKYEQIVVIEGDFSWDDMGDWRALARHHLVEEEHVLKLESDKCIIDWERGPTVTIGVENMVIACSEHGLLVCSLDKLGQLKEAIQSPEFARIQRAVALHRQLDDQKSGQVILKPWGREVLWAHTDNYAAKILVIAPEEATSLQLHQRKEETLYINSGSGFVLLGESTVPAEAGTVIHVKPGVAHRITAISELRIFEVSTNYLDDVIRLEDRYGRGEDGESCEGEI